MGVYKYRDGWQAAVCLKGERRRANFRTQAEAKAWASRVAADMEDAHEPVLGGATRTTLAEMLFEYAQLYTIGKKGALQELNRINRYLEAGGFARVYLRKIDGKLVLVQETSEGARALPTAFAALREARAAYRARTTAKRAELANKQVARISRADLREFVTVMQAEGLSGSDIQKEIALLKHAFNQAIDEWSWAGFTNPAQRLKLPNPSSPRMVILKAEDEARLVEALEQCDSPYVLPLLKFALETTARRGNLLSLQWKDVDLEERMALLRDTKGGHHVPVPLTLQAVAILRALPRTAGESRVFPLTAEALNAVWDRVRKKAGLDGLQFRDVRHVGATRHGKRLGSPHLLKHITGHRSTRLLDVYVNFLHEDLLAKLDATESADCAPTTPPDADAETLRRHNKARRLNERGAGRQAPATAPSDAVVVTAMETVPHAGANVVSFAAVRAQRLAAKPTKGDAAAAREA